MTRRALLILVPAALAAADKKDKKRGKGGKNPSGVLGLLAGTVFAVNGRSLPGARVVATDESDPKARFETVSDGRGEFAIRAPAPEDLAASRVYRLRAEAKGFQPAEKTVEVAAGQRTNANLLLEPEAN